MVCRADGSVVEGSQSSAALKFAGARMRGMDMLAQFVMLRRYPCFSTVTALEYRTRRV